jgi:hypothetical protein
MHYFTVNVRKLYFLIDELLTQFRTIISHDETASSSLRSCFHASEISADIQEVKKFIPVVS